MLKKLVGRKEKGKRKCDKDRTRGGGIITLVGWCSVDKRSDDDTIQHLLYFFVVLVAREKDK